MTHEELFEKISRGRESMTPEEIAETESAATASCSKPGINCPRMVT